MSAAGAQNEYSRGPGASSGGSEGGSGPASRGVRRRFGGDTGTGGDGARSAPIVDGRARLILAGALLAGLLLIAAEFLTLYQVHLASRAAPIESVTAGSHNSYAMLPIGLLGAALAVAVWRGANRPALLAIGLLGVVALLIALLGDLPDAHAVGLADADTVNAATTPNAGLYVETFGAILLIATSGLGLAMLGFPRRSAPPAPKSRVEGQ